MGTRSSDRRTTRLCAAARARRQPRLVLAPAMGGAVERIRRRRPGRRQSWSVGHGRGYSAARPGVHSCAPERTTDIRARKAGDGRGPRQTGQVRKEAAVTSFAPGRRPAFRLPAPAGSMEPPLRARRLPGPRPRLPAHPALGADRPGSARPHAEERVRVRPHRPCLPAVRHPRRRQDHDRTDHRPRPQLHRPRRPGRADARALRRLPELRRDRRGPCARRDRDGRRLADREGGRARAARRPPVTCPAAHATRSTSWTRCTCSRPRPGTRCSRRSRSRRRTRSSCSPRPRSARSRSRCCRAARSSSCAASSRARSTRTWPRSAPRKESTAEPEALALIARAAEGSVRDALSLLDQAIATGRRAGRRRPVQGMLGLADRVQLLDLFDTVIRAIRRARSNGSPSSMRGAPTRWRWRTTCWRSPRLSRLKVAPRGARPGSRRRGRAGRGPGGGLVAGRCWRAPGRSFSRDRRDSRGTRRRAAAEMVLLRVACIGDLPPPAELARLLRGGRERRIGRSQRPALGDHDRAGSTPARRPVARALRQAEPGARSSVPQLRPSTGRAGGLRALSPAARRRRGTAGACSRGAPTSSALSRDAVELRFDAGVPQDVTGRLGEAAPASWAALGGDRRQAPGEPTIAEPGGAPAESEWRSWPGDRLSRRCSPPFPAPSWSTSTPAPRRRGLPDRKGRRTRMKNLEHAQGGAEAAVRDGRDAAAARRDRGRRCCGRRDGHGHAQRQGRDAPDQDRSVAGRPRTRWRSSRT